MFQGLQNISWARDGLETGRTEYNLQAKQTIQRVKFLVHVC